MAKQNANISKGYTATKIQSRWDPTVKPQDRIPRSIDAGPKIVECNKAYGGDLIEHVTSEDAAQSGGKKHHENIPPVRKGAKPTKGY